MSGRRASRGADRRADRARVRASWRRRRGEWQRTVEISAHVLNPEHAQSYAALLKAYDIAPVGHPVVVAPAEP